ncbi:MAG: hypothetical protein CL916_02860 [Deltaproteobacteria bacterium]|nr:hypothetical protein [Deltaproteobacteria bacterium]
MKSQVRLIDQEHYFSDTERQFMLNSLRHFDNTIHTISELEWEMNYRQDYSSLEDVRTWSDQVEYSFRHEMTLWILGMLARLKVPWVMELKKLDFHYKLMRVIPENIQYLSHIEVLDISNNKLQFLPESFSKLINLNILKIQFNRFEVFPKEIFALTKLKKLWIFANQLKALPSSVIQLTQLEELNASCMGLESIPNMIQLQELKHLNLNGNRISSLPLLPLSIQYLMVGHNNISALPSLERHPSLREVHAQNNPIAKISQIPSGLEYLNVEKTKVFSEEVDNINIKSFFTGNPYTGIRKHAIDGNNTSVFDRLFMYFPLAHSAIKQSGINIICDESMRRSCFRKTFDENYAIQKQALVDMHQDFLDQENTYFIFFSRLRGRVQFEHYFDQDPQMFGFLFPYEGGMDFFHKGGRVGTADWEQAYQTLMDWIKGQNKTTVQES